MYQIKKIGDSGPMAIKLMEMHGLGCTVTEMGGFMEECVHQSRKKFVMEVYDSLVILMMFYFMFLLRQ